MPLSIRICPFLLIIEQNSTKHKEICAELLSAPVRYSEQLSSSTKH